MMRLDYVVFGYRRFTFDENDIVKAAGIFLRLGISVKFIGNTFYAGDKKSKKIEEALMGKVAFSKSELLGFFGMLSKNKKRVGVLCSAVFTVLLFAFSSDRVWDVRIEGCEKGVEEKIIMDLERCGFTVGASWSKTDTSHVEVEFLSKSEDVSWININRRGTVAYVTVIDKEAHSVPDEKSGYANIVAECDAVIEEITVMRGIAMVKAGDTVKKGDLLISGVIPSELGGGFCYAEGVVIGRISDNIEVKIPNLKEEKVQKKKKLSNLSVKILGFSVNIFKSYRNSGENCDIIKEKNKISLFGVDIPICVNKKYAVSYLSEKVQLTEDEMTEIALNEMTAALTDKLADSNLIRISTNGKFLDSSYVMSSDIVFSRQIGRELSFDVQNS